MICMESFADDQIFLTNKNRNDEKNKLDDVDSLGFIGGL